MITSNVYKGGRCFNAAHRDAGNIVHIIEGAKPNGYWGDKALCGAGTGKRSYGWAQTNKVPTCAKCIKRLVIISSITVV